MFHVFVLPFIARVTAVGRWGLYGQPAGLTNWEHGESRVSPLAPAQTLHPCLGCRNDTHGTVQESYDLDVFAGMAVDVARRLAHIAYLLAVG